MDNEREAFENWFTLNQDDYDCEVGSKNYYDLMASYHAGYKASIAHSNERIAELEKVHIKHYK